MPVMASEMKTDEGGCGIMYETIGNIYALIITVFSLNMAIGRYISTSKRCWLFMSLFLLSNNITNYYWAEFNIIMHGYPTLSALLTYLGWNLGYIFLILLLREMQTEEERAHLSVAQYIPLPLGIIHFLFFYRPGEIINSFIRSIACLALASVALQSISYYHKNKKNGAKRPYVAIIVLVYSLCQFASWTVMVHEFSVPWLNPYGYLLLIIFTLYPVMIGKLNKQIKETGEVLPNRLALLPHQFRTAIDISYLTFIILASIGGYFIGIRVKNILEMSRSSDAFEILAIVLFIFSVGFALFTAMVMFIAGFGQKVVESNEMRKEKDIAEQANTAKSDFLANMSHEIRTPLNAVLGMNEMIINESIQARDMLPEEREVIKKVFNNICNYAGNIRNAGNNLLSIINDILDFSKIEAGKMELTEKDYKLSSVLNDASNIIAVKAKTKGIEFDVDVDKSLPDGLFGDETRVRQVLFNVLNNAVKYTDAGNIKLTVTGIRPEDNSEDQRFKLRISVKDTGRGIKPEDLKKLYGKFERVDLLHNSTTEGTGLGLAITHNLVDMMGGEIDVESVYHSGSTFTITLPQKIVSDEAVGDFREKFEQSIRDAKVQEELFTAPDARILIVDDTKVNILVAVGLLKKTEIVVDSAISGQEAVQMAKKTKYDMILMDQRMPEMDGTEAMKIIKSQEDGLNRDTIIVCMTADAVIGAKERYLAEGFDDYLTKPVDSIQMKRLIMKRLPKEKVIRNHV